MKNTIFVEELCSISDVSFFSVLVFHSGTLLLYKVVSSLVVKLTTFFISHVSGTGLSSLFSFYSVSLSVKPSDNFFYRTLTLTHTYGYTHTPNSTKSSVYVLYSDLQGVALAGHKGTTYVNVLHETNKVSLFLEYYCSYRLSLVTLVCASVLSVWESRYLRQYTLTVVLPLHPLQRSPPF